jgi:transposase
MTGRNYAGENLHELLKARAKSLSPPIQMCDALSRNVPKEL